MSLTAHLHLFEGFGIELEYMIVDAATLAVLPLADVVLTRQAGECVNEVELGDMAWSNELVMHVLEVKTNGPAPTLTGLDLAFARQVTALNAILAERGAMLLPTAMHPLMRPETDTRLWPHDNAAVYDAYNRIFGCKGHGWSNLQSIHINLPFFDDEEFGRLHAAVRLVLPILPALAASSPLYEGRPSGFSDSRLEFYRHNQRAVPSITGGVIPEPVYSRQHYEEQIFARIYADIAPHDPAGILRDEWLNSRGAIARFDRNAIEIRVLDIQESPRMDLAVIALVVSAVQALVDERWSTSSAQRLWPAAALAPTFVDCVRLGGAAQVKDPAYLAALGYRGRGPVTAQELWCVLAEDLLAAGRYPVSANGSDVLALVRGGSLSARLLTALGPTPPVEAIRATYLQLAKLLAANGRFDA